MPDLDCSFCRIVRGESEAAVVWEDETSLAFLDARPLFPGHTLLVPKPHHQTLMDLPPPLVGPLFANARLLAGAVERGLEAQGSFVALNNRISQSVPHLHVHVVPRRRRDGLRGFFWPRTRYQTDEEMRAVRDRLRAALREVRAGATAER